MLQHQTAISLGEKDERELMQLLSKLELLTGEPIETERQIVISTNSPDVAAMLNALASSITNDETNPTVAIRKNGHKQPGEKKVRKKK